MTLRTASRAALRFVLTSAIVLVLVEGTCQVAYRATQGSWLFGGSPGEEIAGAFEPHPHLVGVPRPGFSREEGGVRISHNRLGIRGPEVPQRPAPGVRRVVAVGGSTTYGVGVSDGETWPALLAEALGPGWEVLNLGVPGYSSAENVIQTALLLSDLQPEIALFYEGWNDLRNSHVADLAPDYANFHAVHLYWNLGLFRLRAGNRSALVFYLRELARALFVDDPWARVRYRPTPDRLTDAVDGRVLALYRRNLASLVALCRAQGIRPILIPQVLNADAMVGDEPGRWVPLIRERDLPVAMEAFNLALLRTARRQGAEAVAEVLDEPFAPEDFIDHGHFSARGNRRFARLLAARLRATPAGD